MGKTKYRTLRDIEKVLSDDYAKVDNLGSLNTLRITYLKSNPAGFMKRVESKGLAVAELGRNKDGIDIYVGASDGQTLELLMKYITKHFPPRKRQ